MESRAPMLLRDHIPATAIWSDVPPADAPAWAVDALRAPPWVVVRRGPSTGRADRSGGAGRRSRRTLWHHLRLDDVLEVLTPESLVTTTVVPHVAATAHTEKAYGLSTRQDWLGDRPAASVRPGHRQQPPHLTATSIWFRIAASRQPAPADRTAPPVPLTCRTGGLPGRNQSGAAALAD